MLKGITERKFYMAGRGLSTVGSLLLALIYSHDLGLTNRSILALIMTVNSLSWIFLTSGSTLTLRKLGSDRNLTSYFPSFVSLFLLQLLMTISVCVSVILIYSKFKVSLPLPLFYISLVYIFCSGLHLFSIEVITALKKFKLVAQLEILTIFLQFGLYFLFKFFTGNSIAISLLLSISCSYITIFLASLVVILNSIGSAFHFENPKPFWKQTRGNHSLGPILGIMDRSDRVLIGFFLATPLLGAYAVTSSLITVVRFIPDVVSRITVARSYDLLRIPKLSKVFSFLLIAAIILLAVELTRLVITLLLGSEWLIPYTVCVFMALQELVRGWYQIVANRLIARGSSARVHKVSVIIPVVTLLTCVLSINRFGLTSVPITFSSGYFFGLCVLGKSK